MFQLLYHRFLKGNRSREFKLYEENEPQNIEQATAEGRRKQAHTDLDESGDLDAVTLRCPVNANSSHCHRIRALFTSALLARYSMFRNGLAI